MIQAYRIFPSNYPICRNLIYVTFEDIFISNT